MNFKNHALLICLVVASLLDGQILSAQVEADSWANRWDTLANMPESRKRHGSCVIDKKIYVLGGFKAHWFVNGSNVFLVYDTEADTWEKVDVSHQFERLMMSLLSIEGKIYVMGGAAKYSGSEDDHTFFSVDVYDPATNTWQARSNFPGENMGPAVELNNYIYIAGGHNFEIGPVKNMFRYDIHKDVWARMADMNYGRIHHGLVAHKGKIYAIGGITKHGYMQGERKVEVYDPKSDTWSLAPPLIKENLRLHHIVCSIGDDILTFGGQNNTGDGPTHKYIYRLNGISNQWEVFDSLPEANGLAAIERVGDKVYIIGGSGPSYYTIRKTTLSYDLPQLKLNLEVPEEFFLYPNPARTHTQIKFSTSKSTEVQVCIYTSMGQVVKQIVSASLPAGEHEIPVDLSDLEHGIYYVTIISDRVSSQLLIKE